MHNAPKCCTAHYCYSAHDPFVDYAQMEKNTKTILMPMHCTAMEQFGYCCRLLDLQASSILLSYQTNASTVVLR